MEPLGHMDTWRRGGGGGALSGEGGAIGGGGGGGATCPKNWASRAHYLHTSESTYNEHVKQYWCETGEHLLRKWPNTRILSYFGAQNGPEIGPILYASPNEPIQQDWCESRGIFFNKTFDYLNFDSLGGPKCPKNILHAYGGSCNELVNEVWSKSSRK